ncbi:MAG: methyltransferase domain-containing protein [Chloroflexota bacterium]
MNWHTRFQQQARWTRDLREYLFQKAGLDKAQRVLEVGCGTGAVLADLSSPASLHGLDFDRARLAEARVHAPGALLVCADAHSLPYPDLTFDITFCHFLLLWVRDPLACLREMARVTRPGGFVLALAEPDYTARVDEPAALAPLGRWQTEALRRQGADPALGARLADLCARAGIEVLETGTVQRSAREALSPGEREIEWAVLEADLAGLVAGEQIQQMKKVDEQAWARGERVLHIPTYFVMGQV